VIPNYVLWGGFSLCKYTQNSFSLAGLAVACNVAVIAGTRCQRENLLEKPALRITSSCGVARYHSYADGRSGFYLVFLSLSYEKYCMTKYLSIKNKDFTWGDLAKSNMEWPVWLCRGSLLLPRGW